jgi:hypothetical protein
MRPLLVAVRCAFSPSTPMSEGMLLIDLPVVFTVLAAVATIVWNTARACSHVSTLAKKHGSSPAMAVAAALGRQGAMWLVHVAGALWLLWGPARTVVNAHPWLFFGALGSLFAECTSKLLVSHACDQEYRPSYAIIALVAAGPLLAMLGGTGSEVVLPSALAAILPVSSVSLAQCLLVSFAVCMGSLFSFFITSVNVLADALDINVFDITKQRLRAGTLTPAERRKLGVTAE